MQIKRTQFCTWGMRVVLLLPWILQALVVTSSVPGPPPTAILLNANPVNIKRVLYHPYRVVNKRRSPHFYDLPSRSDEYYYDGSEPAFSELDAFPIVADDATDDVKFSSPVIENHPKTRIPFSHHSYAGKFMPPSYSTAISSSIPTFNYNRYRKSSTVHPFTKHSVLRPERDSVIHEATVTSDYKIEDELFNDEAAEDNHQTHLTRNNFTEQDYGHISISSDTISTKIQPSVNNTDERRRNIKRRLNESHFVPTTEAHDASQNNSPVVPFIDTETLLKNSHEVPTYLGTHSSNISVQSPTTKTTIDSIENSTLTPPFDVKENISDILPSVKSSQSDKLSSGALAGIIIAILTGVTIFTSSVIYLLYRRFNGKCTSVVESKFNSDNCGYLDDSLRSSVYLNNHIELPKENSEEMTSLDNDSFLNSLETMTIQNYWADNTKNTKV